MNGMLLKPRGGMFLAAVLLPVLLGGCRRDSRAMRETVVSQPPAAAQRPLRLDSPEPERARIIVEYYRKPVMGRRASMRDVERIVASVTPILEQAARQPDVLPALERLGQDLGISTDGSRNRWVRLQEADLLLESGGDPEDVSSANAVGVAQWIYETGARAGLRIDLARSRALTAVIDPLKREVAWLEYMAKPDSRRDLPGSPRLNREQASAQLPISRARLEQLREQRRIVDERYDPEKALFAHTRYLLGLYRKFPDLQWVFQAFHGGEAGVARLIAKYMGPAWKGTAAQAIRRGDGGRRLSYQRLYFTCSPTTHPAAWSYLYGRGDDHRHYWWKIRAAEEAFALYRRDRAAFQRTWESLVPGRAKEAMWYPAGPANALHDSTDVERAIRDHALVTVAPSADLAITSRYSARAALRPESSGLLRLVSGAYRRAGGKPPLVAGELTVPADRIPKPLPEHHSGPPDPLPASLPGGGPSADFDYHATGLAVDLVRPADDRHRKVLEYVIGYLRDRGVLWFMEENERGPRRYHLVPHPANRDALAAIERDHAVPALPGLTVPAPSRGAADGRSRARPR